MKIYGCDTCAKAIGGKPQYKATFSDYRNVAREFHYCSDACGFMHSQEIENTSAENNRRPNVAQHT